jgi:TRAP-type C4-dicarboxylate transport system permease small subunit
MVRALKLIDRTVARITNCLLLFFLSAMVALISWQVLCRYVLLISTSYAEELCRLSVVWLIFLGAAFAVRRNEHICVEALYNILPGPVKTFCDALMYVLLLILSAVMVRYGILHSLKVAPDHHTSLSYSMSFFFIPCVVAGVQIFIYAAVNLGNLICNLITKKNVQFFEYVPFLDPKENA